MFDFYSFGGGGDCGIFGFGLEISADNRRLRDGAQALGRRLNGFLGLSLNDRTILFLVIVLDRTV